MNQRGKMTDRAMDVCIRRVADGDMESLRALYEELRHPVYRFALSIVGVPEAAEDVAQEAFLRIRAGARNYVPRGMPRAWIFAIVRNLSISERRGLSGHSSLEEHGELPGATEPLPEGEAVPDFLDRLTGEEKQIVMLHVLGELRHSEIASAMNLPYETVRWKYAYALKKLRTCFTPTGNPLNPREGVVLEEQ